MNVLQLKIPHCFDESDNSSCDDYNRDIQVDTNQIYFCVEFGSKIRLF